jgi:Protein of unknown function (DUF1360)
MLERLVLDGLATYRLARLLTMDDLTKGPRDWLWKRAQQRGHHKVAELVTCPHCVGVWAAAGVVLVGPTIPGWHRVRAFLAVAGLASLAATVAGSLEE